MYDQGGETLKKNNQNGFYSLNGQPRTKLIEAVTELNHAAYEHTPTPASAVRPKQMNTELFDTWKRHSVRRKRGP
jgi:hypothetical protein